MTTISSTSDARAMGSILVLQTLIGRLLVDNPACEEILSNAEGFARNIEDEAGAARQQGNEEKYRLLAEVAGGSQQTLDAIENIVRQLQARRAEQR